MLGCFLYRKGQANDPNWTEFLGGEEVPLVTLGDPVYPLLPWATKAIIFSQLSIEPSASCIVEHSSQRQMAIVEDT